MRGLFTGAIVADRVTWACARVDLVIVVGESIAAVGDLEDRIVLSIAKGLRRVGNSHKQN